MHVNTGSSLPLVQKMDNWQKQQTALPPTESCQACHHEFRRMLSAEGAKPESKNRRKYDLGHVGRRFVGGWVSGYVWYLELSRESKHAAQQMRYQNVPISQ